MPSAFFISLLEDLLVSEHSDSDLCISHLYLSRTLVGDFWGALVVVVAFNQSLSEAGVFVFFRTILVV